MATKAQRVRAVLDAIRNADTSQSDIERVLDAFFATYRPTEDPASATAGDKLTAFLQAVRAFVRETVHATEISEAVETARRGVQPPEYGDD